MSNEEKEVYEKQQKELLERLEEEKRKAAAELKLEVLKEQEYDPLAVKNREEEKEPEQIAKEEEHEVEKCGKLEKEQDEKELLYLLKFLKFLGVPTIRSAEWKKDITERQKDFIYNLCHLCFESDPPELICDISCHQASMLINSLLEKDGGRLEATKRQVQALTKIGFEKEEAESLNFKEASSILWKDQQAKRRANLCTAFSLLVSSSTPSYKVSL